MAPIIHEHVKQLVCETELARNPCHHKTKTKKKKAKDKQTDRHKEKARTLKQEHCCGNNAK